MSDVNIGSRTDFFPKKGLNKAQRQERIDLPTRNDNKKAREIHRRTSLDAKVDIPAHIKDFARIKKATDNAPEIDNAEKINTLKKKINEGKYQINYEEIADKMLQEIM